MKIHQSFALVALGLVPVLFFCTVRVLAQSVPEVVPHVVVVQFEARISLPGKTSTTGLHVFDRKAAAYGVHTIERMYPFLDHVDPTPKTRRNLLALRRTYYVRYGANVTPERVSRDLALAPGIVYAEPVPVNRTRGPVRWEHIDPNDPRFNDQPQLGLMRLPEAWDVVKSSDGTPKVVIAIVDGGGEWRHEDLRANVWTNDDEIPDNGIDDDNNGFIDDVHGVNFANGDDTNNDPTGLPGLPGSARHGTAVAGSASAVTNNNVGVAGAAWNAEIMHINAGCDSVDNYICYGYDGILYAATNGADIINASWSSFLSDDQGARHLDQTLDLATDMGALIVAAASNYSLSNDLFRYYPAHSRRVLSVGATEKATRRRAGFSNYGRLVNVFAPGVGILTTGPGNGYILFNGTSFSSPLTAGLAALVKTRFPTMDPDALREHIRLTSESIDLENPGFAGQLGRGMVNALAAVQAPTLPAVRLKRWSWTDQDGDRQIASGDVVTIKATVVNYLSDASGLSVGLVGAEPYSFLDMTAAEVEVGSLAGGDSIEVEFEFRVATNAPDNQWVRLYTRIQDGVFEDGADQLSFRVNLSLEAVHRDLSAFYRATDGDNWIRNDNWDITRVPSEEELDRWVGVVLNEGFLVELAMRANNLEGTLPPELGNLRNLVGLRLSENEGLTGQIPPELGNLERLQVLSLRYNSLSGVIPPKLGSLGKLRGLDLSRNSLSGTIPPQLGSLEQLQELWLHRNSLSGSIPPELGRLEKLWMLSLWGNSLSGSIPSELGDLKRLEVLDLPYNELSGPIPPELGNLTELIVLNLNDNFLSGPIPRELGNLEQLGRLYLDDNSLSGPIPSELGNLEQLQELRLHENSISGSIPPELGNLGQLQWLLLYSNSLSGPIPPELESLEQLQELNLSDNSLSEPIPPELGKLQQLQELRLSDNSLSGPIPPELGNLEQLQELFLSRNSLSGLIPTKLGNLEQLRWLNLSDNSLSGPIPLELGNLGQLKELFLSSNSLSGEIPPEFGNLEQLEWLVLSRNSLSGEIPPELGKLSRLKQLYLGGNNLTGQLPRSLMQLDSLETFHFGDQNLCAPADDEFQMWLNGIPNHSGPTCTTTALHFASDIPDQSFPRALPITPLILPEAQGGISPISYALTPTLPSGLAYDSSTRTISGTPTIVTSSPVPYTFKATDSIGETDSLVFSIEVFSPVASEQQESPESFMVHGNYPNPFRESTYLVVDLPWSATLNVEVIDVMGRRVLSPPPVNLPAGWGRSIRLEGAALPSGLYLYRIRANSPIGIHRQAGRFLRVR
ncbi:MAG: S8 family serine peptidase [Bacteroidota bacterium]|nr:S8 family serine peptidase [Bacteroidota bacterium]